MFCEELICETDTVDLRVNSSGRARCHVYSNMAASENVKKHEGNTGHIWFSDNRNQMLVECETDMKQAVIAQIGTS